MSMNVGCSTVLMSANNNTINDNQSDPTDLTGYVNLFLSRTGIRMPVRLELYRHTYACMTGVIQAYVCLYNLS